MTKRIAWALLCGRWDPKERSVLMVLAGAGRPMDEQDVVLLARRIGGLLRESRYRKAVERLRQDGVLAEVEPGRLAVAEPDAWTGRVSAGTLAVIDRLSDPRSPSRHLPVYLVFLVKESNLTLVGSPLGAPGRYGRAVSIFAAPPGTRGSKPPKKLPRRGRPRSDAVAAGDAVDYDRPLIGVPSRPSCCPRDRRAVPSRPLGSNPCLSETRLIGNFRVERQPLGSFEKGLRSSRTSERFGW